MKNIRIIIVSLSFILLTSCALKPITSEYAFIKTNIENVELNDLGNGNVLIYNGANILHKMDNTARLNIWLDNKPLGQIRPSEYVIINLKNGKNHFKVLHIDVVNMRSEHEVEIDIAERVPWPWAVRCSHDIFQARSTKPSVGAAFDNNCVHMRELLRFFQGWRREALG